MVSIKQENSQDTFAVLGDSVSKKAIETRFGRGWDQVAYLVDRHSMVVQSWLASRSPHAEQFRPEIQPGLLSVGGRSEMRTGCSAQSR